jgi:hypothetical protein
MITSQRAELPSKINVYYATWTRLGLSGVLRQLHHVYGRASIEFDGNRTLGMKAARQVRLFARNGKDFTARFTSIAKDNQRSATS